MLNFPARRAALALALALFVPQHAEALSYTPQTPITVAGDAAQVVIATIASAEPTTTPEGVEIELLTLKVHERWRGDGGPTVHVRQVRYVHDLETGARAYVPGNPRLEAGKTYRLFLPPEQELPTLPMTVAGESGAYEAQRVGADWQFRTLSGRRIVDISRDGWVTDLGDVPGMVHPPGQDPLPPKPRPVAKGEKVGADGKASVATRWRALVQAVQTRGASGR